MRKEILYGPEAKGVFFLFLSFWHGFGFLGGEGCVCGGVILFCFLRQKNPPCWQVLVLL